MRVKRALQKMSTLLKGRGVTLSAPVVASALGAELARAAPAQAVAALSSKALAASSSISLTTLLANTMQTMTTSKTITVTGAAVVAIASVPFFQLRAEGSRIQTELASISARVSSRKPDSCLRTP